MFTKCFVAAAIMLASPAFASAQDIYWSLSPEEVVSTSTLCLGDSTTGSAYIYSDEMFFFNALDLNFTTSDSDVIRFTGGEAFNPLVFSLFGPGVPRFDSTLLTIDTAGSSGGLFIVDLSNPLGPLFDPAPEFVIGPPFFGGPVLLARVDYEVIGEGTSELEFALGPQGAVELPDIILNPSFGSATLTVELPTLAGCLGDVNLSGSVDFLDVLPFIAALVSGEYQLEADINGDGVVSFLDVGPFIEILAGN